MLADAVNKIQDGPFKDVHFSESEMYELRIAAWLHDCGKVTTPEYVVDKATKLETIYDRIHEVAARTEVKKRDAEIRLLRQQLALERKTGLSPEEKKQALSRLRSNYRKTIRRLEDDLAFLEDANVGGEFMSQEKKDRVRKIARASWTLKNQRLPFLNDDEVKNLLIARGTLTHEERKIINNHITQTIKMLKKLPYPKHLQNVPEFAGGHHEKMDGTGYPMGLTANEMSIQARIMAIADIFEALTARDRPYKKGKTLSEAMRILGFMKNDAHIDPDLFRVFVEEKIYLKYGSEYLDPKQMDMVS
ncbi:MAG: HD domain-containing protein, partial [Candidatus Neomarinimicrobiota bacterium]